MLYSKDCELSKKAFEIGPLISSVVTICLCTKNSLVRDNYLQSSEFHIKEAHFQQYHFPFQSQIEFIMFLTTTMHI